ncbi:26S proteasome non-ATPase regulatory subunit 5 [Ceratitis capitata]|uniref:26S proteasome non-ATPase regulatory subunit 5 n=1 Tax=Ceratitis capitata TaxID=7213 RepID=UPI000329F743|nr:26S proteasome non-ATPase regulatory subunit 5 [Ceratitis capitata]
MSESWFCEQIQNLSNRENRLSILADIRLRLYGNEDLAGAEFESSVATRLLSVPEFWECLDGKESSQHYDLAKEILSICMSRLRIEQNNTFVILETALSNSKPDIKAIILNTILKQFQMNFMNNKDVQIPIGLLKHILNGLQHEASNVGVPALEILKISLARHIDDHLKQQLLDMLSTNEIVKCRIYELAVSVAIESPTSLQQVEFLLDNALSELDNDDVLLQVNILEILVSLAEQNHGLLYLENRKVFEIIGRRVENVSQNPLDELLIPGIMKFFSKAASVQPQKLIIDYPHMIKCLFESIFSGKESILPAAFDALANLTQSYKGIVLLDQNYPALIKETFESIASYLRSLPTDLKNRAFNALEIVFLKESNADIGKILRKWFTYLACGESMQFLMDYCRNPFPDIKVSCLRFIKSVCHHRWGIVALKNTAGFIEYLLDRNVEFDKEAKYVKYEIISAVADSDVFDAQINLQLRTYVNEGPYFVESILDIATEGN